MADGSGPGWFRVSGRLPEDCEACRFYDDGSLRFATVLVMDGDGRMEIRNRLKIKESNPAAWKWSDGIVDPEYWFPIPRNALLREDAARQQRR